MTVELNGDDDLDMSWLIETERLSKINQKYSRENMNEIQIHSIYISKTNHIEKITSTNQSLHSFDQTSEFVGLLNSDAIKLVDTNNKYKLLDILVFNVDLEPENIQDFSKMDELGGFSSRFLKSVYMAPTIQDIKIPPSIFIFHNLNAIYFLFQEIVIVSPKSILKSSGSGPSGSGSNLRKTKKVSIQLPNKPCNKTKHVY
jgi:hypothetical protein